MQDPLPLAASEVAIACVTEDNPKYLGQALRLVQSIRWLGGELSRSRFVVCALERIDSRARRALEALGAEVRIVPRFDEGSASGNRLQAYSEIWDGSETTLLVLDCDTIVVRDPLPFLRRDVFQAKVAPAPTVTHEAFERLFARLGLPLPARSYVTGYTGTPTIPYFNAGVTAMPVKLARQLVPVWRHFDSVLARERDLLEPWTRHHHQAALSVALAVTGVPVAEAPLKLNFQLNMTHLPAPAGYDDLDPVIIHYHHLVNDEGFLLPCPFPASQRRINQFHERLREEHTRNRHRSASQLQKPAPPQQFPVLGMHRSGTSLVAQLLTAMGCYAGEGRDLPPPDVYNPTGYWEHRGVVELNEEILEVLHTTWLDPGNAQVARLPEETRMGFVDRARTLVQALDAHGSWMMKDPRLSILFPLWREVLDRPICVLVWRDPEEVALSIERRDGLPRSIAVTLWEEYTRSMLASTLGLPRVLVSYHDLVTDPIACVARLQRELSDAGAQNLRLPSEEELRSIIEPSLNPHSRNGGGVLNAAQSELLAALRSGAALQWKKVAPARHDNRELLTAFSKKWRENEEAGELDLLLEAVFASRSWRIGFAITRLWRRLVPSHGETAVDRWKRRRARIHRPKP